jgi:hypothetical protein
MDNKDNKVIRIPIDPKQRKINEYGPGYVPCEVTDRWLQFPEAVSDKRYIPVSVMTTSKDGMPKKITDLVLSSEDLLRAINSIKIKNED